MWWRFSNLPPQQGGGETYFSWQSMAAILFIAVGGGGTTMAREAGWRRKVTIVWRKITAKWKNGEG